MKFAKKIPVVVMGVILLGFPVLVYFNAQNLVDWWKLRGYTPPASVSALASEDTMTKYATHVFYVNHPQIVSDTATFRQDCSENEQTIVLGCYHPEQEGIFVYNVSDPRLSGVQQVTAAHEMLHAAYDRLSTKEKNYVDGLLLNYYNNDLKDQRLIDTINAYKKTEPNDVVNEMHSVFGTEVASLPTPLENYYKKYFINRQAITSYAANYENEFTSRQSQISADSATLASLKTQITIEETSLQAQSDQINTDRANLNAENSPSQIDEYNAAVESFNTEVDAYNNGVTKLKNDIAYYNQQVDSYNNLASQLASLNKAIDTRLTTQTTQ